VAIERVQAMQTSDNAVCQTELESLQYMYLVSDNTRLGLVLEGLVSVEQLQQLVSTQVAAALVCCLAVQESSLRHKPCLT